MNRFIFNIRIWLLSESVQYIMVIGMQTMHRLTKTRKAPRTVRNAKEHDERQGKYSLYRE